METIMKISINIHESFKNIQSFKTSSVIFSSPDRPKYALGTSEKGGSGRGAFGGHGPA